MKLEPGQIAIVFTPVIHEGEWTGDIHTGLVFGEEKHSKAMAASMDAAITMSATQFFLDDNPEYEEDFDEIKAMLLEEMFPTQYAAAKSEYEEQQDDGYEVKGNVITLNKWTKTQGSA